MPSFSLIFDRLGYWPRPKVVWCMPSDIPSALLDLAARLDAACVACGLPADTRAYVPHLTLLRKARQAPPVPEMPATTWTVRDFALIHSETRSEGVVYTVLKRWALQ
jgi:2'-5' RNA ligase